jgi:hypothetical protein
MDFKDQLTAEKRSFFIRANGGIALPAAGCMYWLGLSVAGYFLKPQMWFFVSAFSSGLIFPLGLLLSKPLKSDILKTASPLNGIIGPALIAMAMFWPLAIAGAASNVSFITLALAIGMGIHWPVIGWMYGRKVYLLHGIIRTVGTTMLWYIFPDQRFVLIPVFVSLAYLITIFGIKRELAAALKEEAVAA